MYKKITLGYLLTLYLEFLSVHSLTGNTAWIIPHQDNDVVNHSTLAQTHNIALYENTQEIHTILQGL